MVISIMIQKSAYQPRYQEIAHVLSFLTMCTSNIPITPLPPFSTPSLSSACLPTHVPVHFLGCLGLKIQNLMQ